MLTRRLINLSSRHCGIRQLHVEKNLDKLGIVLPKPNDPKGNYLSFVRSGNMLFLAGHLPQSPDGTLVTGKVGKDITVQEGYDAARTIALNLISTMKFATGDLDKVKRVVKLVGFVNCNEDFTQQPSVINGCSDMMVEVFGPEVGRHARSAVGTNALPLGVSVEVEAIIEVE
mmetsp:Transcript_23174/g.33983  ORF Transcript_23174/g.33983 Transcript_23174/m.33983 type:complete len:172 (-) Transcript_23174:100-615(-)|eukprot:CAMPEP_0185024886 /NCGR_PEP_ID=MMETSP1103-20130426/8060_1 /TAXON_ID=36769 /ORGANISM="Paraphysomonas bandaiensis, Strain Caron Lab Isolate" /LENGTH=171 /DNA_ID=CAMNT_0027557965 /DNA_START=46 /DNA_END=561 /DNA_ORIENTATION=+